MVTEQLGSVAVSWSKGTKHRLYEDRYRILSRDVPLVSGARRGEIFAVFDGIGSAPRGMSAAQEMADCLVRFFRDIEFCQPSWRGIHSLLLEANNDICKWGFMTGTDRPLGGCAGTVVWLLEEKLTILHAGDTKAMLIRDGQANTLTRDHHASDGALYRFFGLGDSLKIDVEQFTVEESDRILLMSDGVTQIIEPYQAVAIVEENIDVSRAVESLAQRSLALGTTDDITAMLVQIEEIWE